MRLSLQSLYHHLGCIVEVNDGHLGRQVLERQVLRGCRGPACGSFLGPGCSCFAIPSLDRIDRIDGFPCGMAFLSIVSNLSDALVVNARVDEILGAGSPTGAFVLFHFNGYDDVMPLKDAKDTIGIFS